jgi:MFS family permease
MYPLDPKRLREIRFARVSGIVANVWFLGLTSLLTDVSSEMVTAILPIWFVFAMGMTPLQFGFIDGLSQGVAAVARLASGLVGDRWRRHRDVAILGYGMSAACKIGLLAAGGAWGLASAAIAVDRIGKGIRTSPRDSLISLSAAPERLGLAFGIHRALDTIGALLGPLLAFAILAALPRAFDLVFVTSFFIAIAGVAAIACFVRDVATASAPDAPTSRSSVVHAFALLRDARLRAISVAGFLLGLFTMADAFVYLALQQKLSTQPSWFPLFYALTAVAYLALAIPAGVLGDRFGRTRMFLVGHVLLLLAGVDLIALPADMPAALLVLVLLGAYYACTDGVLMALASAFVPPALRGSGLGLVATANGVARLLASLLFGALWETRGMAFALAVFAVGLGLTLLASLPLLKPLKESPRP